MVLVVLYDAWNGNGSWWNVMNASSELPCRLFSSMHLIVVI